MKRHIAIHSREESGDLSELRQPKRAAQACVGCVRSKQRCVGSTPCNRCNRRGIGCVYPTSTNDSEHMKSRLPILHEEEIILPTTSSTGIIASQDSSSDIVTGTANVTENIGFQISHINNGALGTKSSCTNPNTENSGISTQGLGFDMNQSLPYYDQTYVSADDFMSGLFPHLFSLPTGWGDTTGDLPTSFYEGQSSSSYFVERNASHTIHDTCRSLTPLQTPLQTPISTGNNERNHILLTPDEQSPLVVFPNVQSNDLSSIAADRFGHSAPISDGAYSKIRHIYTNQRQGASALLDDTAFPPVEVLNSFVELFFEHFNHTVPIVHQATFKPTAEEWILLLGILAVGSQYSSLPSREQFGETFQSLLQRVISRKVSCSHLNAPNLYRDADLSLRRSTMAFQSMLDLAFCKQSYFFSTTICSAGPSKESSIYNTNAIYSLLFFGLSFPTMDLFFPTANPRPIPAKLSGLIGLEENLGFG